MTASLPLPHPIGIWTDPEIADRYDQSRAAAIGRAADDLWCDVINGNHEAWQRVWSDAERADERIEGLLHAIVMLEGDERALAIGDFVDALEEAAERCAKRDLGLES